MAYNLHLSCRWFLERKGWNVPVSEKGSEETVGSFTGRSDYNFLVDVFDISSDAQTDKDKNKIRVIIGEIKL